MSQPDNPPRRGSAVWNWLLAAIGLAMAVALTW